MQQVAQMTMWLFNRTFFLGAGITLSLLWGGVSFAQTQPTPAAPPSGGVNLGGGYTLGMQGNTTDTGWVFGPGVNNGGGGTTNTGGAAQGLNFVPLVKDYPQLGRMQNSDIPSFLNTLFAITIAVAATLAVIMVAIGGIEYMLTESPFKMGDAKDRIGSAIFGLIIVLTSVLLLRTINPQIVSLNLFTPSKPVSTPAASQNTTTMTPTTQPTTQPTQPTTNGGIVDTTLNNARDLANFLSIPAKVAYDAAAPTPNDGGTMGSVVAIAKTIARTLTAPGAWLFNQTETK